ncbi:MAG TPA: response regulator [Bryobacteraceae bacterium]|jgi:CheY-like chemotaxis protein|nr:response regulator [Bryobacteraceae bacterium]
MTAFRWHVLLAEDNPADILVVREALSNEQIECDLRIFEDGEEVIKAIDQLDADSTIPCPDLLLLDLHLPKRDGEEIIRHLRGSCRCGKMPVIVLTASMSPHHRETAERNAVLHYFQKSPNIESYLAIGPLVKEVLVSTAGEAP